MKFLEKSSQKWKERRQQRTKYLAFLSLSPLLDVLHGRNRKSREKDKHKIFASNLHWMYFFHTFFFYLASKPNLFLCHVLLYLSVDSLSYYNPVSSLFIIFPLSHLDDVKSNSKILFLFAVISSNKGELVWRLSC